MTTPIFINLLEDSKHIPLAVYLWQDWKAGKDRKAILKRIDEMDEPAFKKFIQSIK